MGWASAAIEKLKQGQTVQVRPNGNSMSGHVESGQLCTIEPVLSSSELKVGDIVLCRVEGREYLHLIKAISVGRFKIGNARGNINGWVSGANLFGRCTRVEP